MGMTAMLEKQIEAKVCDYAKERGVLVYKFTSPARAAVPDRMFIRPDGKVFFIEFKREGLKPTPAQEREHHRLRQYKMPVFVIDNVDEGKVMVDTMLTGV
jgi:type I site-specific restriction endonuclease